MSNAIKDEQGSWSSARIGMWTNLFFLYGYIVWTSTPSPVVMSALSAIEMSFMGWAAGPRIAQYLLPVVGQVAQGIGMARPPIAGMDHREGDDAERA
jgi:hypothetical protein